MPFTLTADELEDVELSNIAGDVAPKRKIKTKKEKFGDSKKLLKDQGNLTQSLTKKTNYICQKIKNTLIISIDQNGTPILTIGPDWYLYLILSTIITAGFLFLFIRFFQFVPTYLFISGIVTYILFISVYTRLLLKNPGFPQKVDINTVRKARKNYMYCSYCDMWVNKKLGIKHCHRCGMCVEKYDHHCDWISKCVGSNNVNEFYFFIIWVVMVVIYFIAAFVIVHENWFEYQRYLRNIEKMKNKLN